MTTTATAAVLRNGDCKFELEEIELGPLASDELLVKVVGAGMCHTDLHILNPDLVEQIGPIILGHEGSGIVEEVGSAVRGIEVGDHVLISYDSCGHCRNCRSGLPSYCDEFMPRNATGRRTDFSTSAVDQNGLPLANRWFGQSSFATHAIATERNLVVVDKSLPLELLGPLGCGLQTGAGSVLNEMKLSAGQSIAVFGAGGVGLAAVMAAKAAGARDIVVVDLLDSRLETALEVGATRTVRGDTPDLVEAIKNGGRGLDFSFETTAVASVITTAISVLDMPGKAVLVGGSQAKFEIDPTLLTGRTVTYALEGSSIPQVFLPQLVDLWQRGWFPFDKLVQTYPLEQINQAVEDSLSGKTIKPVLTPAQH